MGGEEHLYSGENHILFKRQKNAIVHTGKRTGGRKVKPYSNEKRKIVEKLAKGICHLPFLH